MLIIKVFREKAILIKNTLNHLGLVSLLTSPILVKRHDATSTDC